MTNNDRVYISEACRLLNRTENTIRRWEREKLLPEELISSRDSRNWRYWKLDQINKIMNWIISNRMYPGNGLPNYNPSPFDIDRHVINQRKPRKTKSNAP